VSFATQVNNAVLRQFQNFQGLTLAKVAAYYPDTATADIDFLKTTETFNAAGAKQVLDYPKAYKIPCMAFGGANGIIRASYKKGDVVFVAFAVSEISKSADKTSDLSAFLSKGNCVVLAGLLTSAVGALVKIGSEENNIQVKEDEILLTVGLTTLSLKADGAHLTVAGVPINLFTHLHGSAVGPTSPPTPGT
jgi:hypothetical protein